MCCPVTLQIAFPAAFAADGDLNVTRVRLGDSSFAYDAARDAPWGAAPRDSTADDDDAAVMGTWSARLLRAPVDGNATIELARSGNGRWLGAGVQLTVTFCCVVSPPYEITAARAADAPFAFVRTTLGGGGSTTSVDVAAPTHDSPTAAARGLVLVPGALTSLTLRPRHAVAGLATPASAEVAAAAGLTDSGFEVAFVAENGWPVDGALDILVQRGLFVDGGGGGALPYTLLDVRRFGGQNSTLSDDLSTAFGNVTVSVEHNATVGTSRYDVVRLNRHGDGVALARGETTQLFLGGGVNPALLNASGTITLTTYTHATRDVRVDVGSSRGFSIDREFISVSSMSGGATDVLVADQAKSLRFEGVGVGDGDVVAWLPLNLTADQLSGGNDMNVVARAAAAQLTDADCATLHGGAVLATNLSLVTPTPADLSAEGLTAALTTLLVAPKVIAAHGESFALCYRFANASFGDESFAPYKLYPNVTLALRHLSGVVGASAGALDRGVAGVAKSLTLAGHGLGTQHSAAAAAVGADGWRRAEANASSGDVLRFMPVGAGNCTDAAAAALLLGDSCDDPSDVAAGGGALATGAAALAPAGEPRCGPLRTALKPARAAAAHTAVVFENVTFSRATTARVADGERALLDVCYRFAGEEWKRYVLPHRRGSGDTCEASVNGGLKVVTLEGVWARYIPRDSARVTTVRHASQLRHAPMDKV